MGIFGNLTLLELQDQLPSDQTEVFVETGTYHGDSLGAVASRFEKLHTIELDVWNYQLAKSKLEKKCPDYPRITFHLGDSREVLGKVVKEIPTDSKVVWFLDAHSCGTERVPLLEEIQIILGGGFTQNQVFIIDDVRLFDKYWDWAGVTVEGILGIVSASGATVRSHAVVNDRLYITL